MARLRVIGSGRYRMGVGLEKENAIVSAEGSSRI